MKKLLLLSLSLLCLTFVTSCGDNNKTPDEPLPPVTEGLAVQSSARYFLADGTKTIQLSVIYNGVDVTAKSRVMDVTTGKSKLVEGGVFKTSVAGQYEFYAIYEGMISARINVLAATSFPELPVDAMPAKYDGFRKRVLAIQHTGTWCGWCPRLMKAMHDFNATDTKADDVVFVSAHVQDQFTSDKSTAIDLTYNNEGWPNMIFSLSPLPANQLPNASVPKHIRDLANKLLGDVALSSISVATEVKDNAICVRADVKIASKGNFMIGAFLLEDGQTATQNNSTDVKEDYFNTHNNILRNGYPVKTMYEAVGGVKENVAQTKYDFFCEFGVKASKVADITKTRIVVFVYDSAKQLIDNVVVLKVGDKLSFEYL